MKHLLAGFFTFSVIFSLTAEGVEVGGIKLSLHRGDLEFQGAGLLKKGFWERPG